MTIADKKVPPNPCERTMFEARIRKAIADGMHGWKLKRDSSGDYEHPVIYNMWAGWICRAAASQPLVPPTEFVARIRRAYKVTGVSPSDPCASLGQHQWRQFVAIVAEPLVPQQEPTPALYQALDGLIQAISEREDKHGERFSPEILHACAIGEAALKAGVPSEQGTPPHRIQKFWDAQAEWSQATFGEDAERDHIGPLKHLAKEAVEAQIRPSDPVEIADCLFLVFDAARRSGMTLDTLIKVAEQKLLVNKARKWQRPTDDNPVEHVRALPTPPSGGKT